MAIRRPRVPRGDVRHPLCAKGGDGRRRRRQGDDRVVRVVEEGRGAHDAHRHAVTLREINPEGGEKIGS